MVRNIGAGIYNGAIQIDETVPAGTTATFAPASWNCMAPAELYLRAEDQSIFRPSRGAAYCVVKVPKNLAADLGCEATNEAKIVEAAGGTDQNTDPTDDEAEATMLLPGQVAECPGLPPLSNLKLKKTRPDGKCPVIWGNWICQFKVTVQNFGDALHERGPVHRRFAFRHSCRAAATFQPPAGWTCGGPVLFPNVYQCSSDNPDLAHLAKRRDPGDRQDSRCARGRSARSPTTRDRQGPGRHPAQLLRGRRYEFGQGRLPPFPLAEARASVFRRPSASPSGRSRRRKGEENKPRDHEDGRPSMATATGQNTAFTITVTNQGPASTTARSRSSIRCSTARASSRRTAAGRPHGSAKASPPPDTPSRAFARIRRSSSTRARASPSTSRSRRRTATSRRPARR